MKKTKTLLLLMLAITIFLFSTFLLVSCDKGDGDENGDDNQQESGGGAGTNGSGNGHTQNPPSSEEEIYQYIKQAYIESSKYNGAFTAKASSSANYSEDDETASFDGYEIISVNPEKLIRFDIESFYEDENEPNYSYFEEVTEKHKLFSVDDRYYLFSYVEETYQDNEERENSSWSEYSERPLNVINKDLKKYNFGYFFEDVSRNIVYGIFEANNLEELKSAYKTVWKETVYDVAEYPEENTVRPSVKATYEDGVYSLLIKFNGENEPNQTSERHILIEAKNGKISKVEAYETYTGDENGRDGGTYEFTYSFDQEGYDSIECELPSNKNHIKKYDISQTRVDVYVNGILIESNLSGYDSTTVRDAFDEITQEALSSIADSELLTQGIKKIDGWYTDAACTQKFDPLTATEEDFNKLEALYANITINSRYALVNQCAEKNLAFSRPYLIACEEPYPSYYGGGLKLFDISENPYYRIYRPSNDYDVSYTEVYVNGIKQSDDITEIELKSGNTYEVKYVYVCEDETGELPCW